MPPLSAWAVARLIELPRVRRTLRRIDTQLVRTSAGGPRFTMRRAIRVSIGIAVVLVGASLIVRSQRA